MRPRRLIGPMLAAWTTWTLCTAIAQPALPLGFEEPGLISSNVSPVLDEQVVSAPKLLGSVNMACGAFTNNYAGVAIWLGNASGQYSRLQLFGPTDDFTVSNLDETKPWFACGAFYYPFLYPVITACTNRYFTNYTTNLYVFGVTTPELFFCFSNVAPCVTFSNGSAVVLWWGRAGTHYTLLAGDTTDDLTDDVDEVDGTNGPVFYTEPFLTNAARFFRPTVTTN